MLLVCVRRKGVAALTGTVWNSSPLPARRAQQELMSNAFFIDLEGALIDRSAPILAKRSLASDLS